MEQKFMTESDILGMQLKAKEEIDRLIYGRSPAIRAPFALETLEELLKRDEQREKDGFQKRIKYQRILVGPNRVINVPWVEEEKLIHGEFEPKKIKKLAQLSDEEDEDLGEVPGHGEGEVGDIIGEIPEVGEGGGEGGPEPGTEPGFHEEELFEIGKRLIEKFQLPNLKEKGKKAPTAEYTYDLTDRYKGSGQLLDKKATLREIVKTNILLRRLKKDKIDTSKLIVIPQDRIYRVLSKERLWKSQAVIFFLRDYSGSMWNEPTRIIVEQHLMIYSWLLVQYEKLVTPRFIVHDTQAEEVSAQDYFRKGAGGGTWIPSGYKKIREIVESEGLEKDYNIYVFQGTDGEDFDDGRQAVPELQKILGYVNRMGVCVLRSPYWWAEDRESEFEQYIKPSGIPEKRGLFRMHVMSSVEVTEEKQIEAIKAQIAQD